MMLTTNLLSALNSLPIAAQTASAEGAESASTAMSGELGLIVLGAALLGYGSYMFLVKLCKSLVSGANE